MTLTGDHESDPPAAPGEFPRRSSLDWARQTGVAKNVIREMEVRVMEKKRRLRRRRSAVAATTLMLLGMAGGWWQLRRAAPSDLSSPSAVVTTPGRQQLSDGSIVEINEGAFVTVAYSAAFRRVTLHRGEAHFQVAKHPGRPFIVSAAGVEVRAVGTAFSVQFGQSAIDVLVTEGTVAVDKTPAALSLGQPVTPPVPSAPAETIATVDAGNRVRIEFTAPAKFPVVVPVPAVELADRLSWRVPRLEFSGTPLSQALALFNRHSAVHLTLANPHLGQLKLSGIVRADNTETLLQLLHSELGLTEERRTAGEIVLGKISPSATRN